MQDIRSVCTEHPRLLPGVSRDNRRPVTAINLFSNSTSRIAVPAALCAGREKRECCAVAFVRRFLASCRRLTAKVVIKMKYFICNFIYADAA